MRRANKILNHISTSTSTSSSNVNSTATPISGVITLEKERANANFDPRTITHLINGGEDKTMIRELVAAQIEEDEVLVNSKNRYDLSRYEERVQTMRRIVRAAEFRKNTPQESKNGRKDKSIGRRGGGGPGSDIAAAFYRYMAIYDPQWSTRIGVHYGLFCGALSGQGTEEQLDKWYEDAQSFRIFGCFGMTELGHGSFLRGMETTATFDEKTDEFILNSPTITSSKWWIGGAAHTATHCSAYARMIVNGKDLGVHTFVVPLRNIETGKALPGIEIGDCGAKMGRDGIDNGFIRFHNVRVPRFNLLSRYNKLARDGSYTKPPRPQMSYGALISGRVGMVADSAWVLAKGLTIAVRYSCVRRQFENPVKPGEEMQIIEYQTQKKRLVTMLASCYATFFTSQELDARYEQLQRDLKNNDLSALNVVHATSAGLKAFCTWYTNSGLEVCRQGLGGHGYSKYSGFPSELANWYENIHKYS